MTIIFSTVVSFVPFDSGGEFRGQGIGPFFPREMPLRGEPHGEGKGLGLPRLGEDRPTLITWQRRKRGEVKLAQDSHPRGPDKRNRLKRPPRPITRARRNAPSR